MIGSSPISGVVACTRLALSAYKKPFGSGEFGKEIAKTALEWLSFNGPDSEVFQSHMEEMAIELGHPGLAANDLHERLRAGVGSWNQEETKLSRFFSWAGKFKHFVKYWKFQSLVFTQWQTMHMELEAAEAAEVAATEQDDENQGRQNQGGTLQGKRGQDLLKALKAMQQSRHTLDIVADVLKDESVKKYSHMIFFCQAPFATEYRRVLQKLHDVDPESVRNLQVGWANRHWALEIWNIFASFANAKVMETLNLSNPVAGKEDEQLADAKCFGELLVRAAAQRAWTMAIYDLAPESWCGILDSCPNQSRAALSKMKADAQIVDEAYKKWMTGKDTEQSGFDVVFSNLWLHKLTLVQDPYALPCSVISVFPMPFSQFFA